MNGPTSSTVFLGALISIILVAGPAHGHHVLGVPHYVTDSAYPEPILTLTETVGRWRIELVHSPGAPEPTQSADIRFRVTNVGAGSDVVPPVTVTVRRLHVFGPGLDVHGPDRVTPEEGSYVLSVLYPTEGNYIVKLALVEAGQRSDLVFPVVVGTPGRPWVTLATFVIGLGILLIVVRALKVKRARRCASSA
ncbi:MAG: hypothetical protein GY715_01325 [Planctomycetes bacterium]|nr:hypothetical protein [Planctomycetota bacterium]